MFKLVLVGIGGFAGAILRYLTSGMVHHLAKNNYFPYGTLAVNIFGCLLIGFFSGLAESRQVFTPELRLLIFIGFLGSFTTFSTFGFEVFSFARDGQFLSALANIFLHFLVGFGAVWLGHILSKLI